MQVDRRMLMLASLIGVTTIARAQSLQTPFPPPPTTRATVGQWDVPIVQRAAEILSSPAQWNRNATGTCRGSVKTFSIGCALDRAIEEAAGIHRDAAGARIAGEQPPPLLDCRLHATRDGREGTCGTLLDEVPVFTISRVKAITSGTWRADVHPIEVWAGTMSDAEGPVNDEAERVVGLMTTRKYRTPLVEYNNDSATTFADVQKFFGLLQDAVIERATADLSQSFDSLEIEVYAGGTGVIRTYYKWFPISGFTTKDSTLHFQVDATNEVPPSALDREILVRASRIITSDSVWNRADNRVCPATAKKWSIYCAVELAEVQATGGFHHRRPAMELVRELVDERTAKKTYPHRLMGYNNDPSTHLDDVRSLFAEAISKVK